MLQGEIVNISQSTIDSYVGSHDVFNIWHCRLLLSFSFYSYLQCLVKVVMMVEVLMAEFLSFSISVGNI